jgi:DNA (cytosine-5)-methyltransferase 1
LLAEVLARAIRTQLLGLTALRHPLTLMPPVRLPVPPPEPHTAVPTLFRGLEGIHAPHPGTGRGYGAPRANPRLPPSVTTGSGVRRT